MSSDSHDLVLFLGRFHPVVVHLPIGGLVLLGILELVAKFSRFKDAAQNRLLILGFVAAASLAAALCGWLLGQADGYDPQLLQWHQVDRFCGRRRLHGDFPVELAGPTPGLWACPVGDALRPGGREPSWRLSHPRAGLSHSVCARAFALAAPWRSRIADRRIGNLRRAAKTRVRRGHPADSAPTMLSLPRPGETESWSAAG